MTTDNLHKEKIFRGIVTLLILRFLIEHPRHGYSLALMISEKVKRDLPPGTIYVLLGSLEKRGLIKVLEKKMIRDRKTYTITEDGMRFLLGHHEPLLIATQVMSELISFIESLKSGYHQT